MENEKSNGVPGRPRAFDIDKALEQAMNVFWQKGYEGASLTDLTEAMGINRPSLYATFGNKQALFQKALARYNSGPAACLFLALDAPTARSVVEGLLTTNAKLLTNPCNPHGCMAVQGALACSDAAKSIQQQLIAQRHAAMDGLRERLERAQQEGDLPADAVPAALARFVSTITEGMSVQAAAGATREELMQVVATALRAWPS